jgi:methionine biosynthesis protein MetW
MNMQVGHRRSGELRVDLMVVAGMVEDGSRVLDIGCEDGALLRYLAEYKNVDARGVEISQSGVNLCVAQGLAVVQGDADKDLYDYPDGAFDYAILSQTLQATHNPRKVLEELLRIGHRAIVSFPNFGYWRVRLQLLLHGRMPVTHGLPQAWYETPNIHLCTIRDFVMLCRELGITIERRLTVTHEGRATPFTSTGVLANLFGEQAVFLLRKE